MTYFPAEGDWVRWTTDEFVHEGQVIWAGTVSLEIKWLGVDTPQVFPATEHLLKTNPRDSGLPTMVQIERPSRASQIDRQVASGRMGIAAAAARLGSTPKAVRARLRSGSLKGRQVEGKWVEVFFDD